MDHLFIEDHFISVYLFGLPVIFLFLSFSAHEDTELDKKEVADEQR